MAEHLTRPSGRLTRRTLLSRIARGAVALSLGVGLVPSQAAQADDTPPGYGTPTASQPAPTAVPAGTRAPAPPAATPAPAATAVAVATPVVAATPVFPPASYSTDLLVDTMWLMEHLADPQLKLIELSEDAAYMSGHLPSAGHLRWEDLKLVDSNSATLAAWRDDVQARLGALGITPADPVVVYDDGSLWAARVWWILEALDRRGGAVVHRLCQPRSRQLRGHTQPGGAGDSRVRRLPAGGARPGAGGCPSAGGVLGAGQRWHGAGRAHPGRGQHPL